MKREFLEENSDTLSKSSDIGRVLLYIGECYFLVTPSLLTYHTKV